MGKKLFEAAETGNIGLFRASLNKATVDDVNEYGETPLMVACKLGHVELVKFILSRGADTSISDRNGATVHDMVASVGIPELTVLFSKREVSKLPDTKVLGKRLAELAENIFFVFSEADSLFDRLSEDSKLEIMLDIRSIVYLLRNREDFTLYDGLGVALSMMYLSSREKVVQLISKIKKDSAEGVINLAGELLSSTSKSERSVSVKNFNLKSLLHLDADDFNMLRKVFYEFSELMVKADGTVSDQEAQALKAISKKLFVSKFDDTQASRPANKIPLDSILAELNGLVGMENIKGDIKSLINVIKVNQLRKKEGLPEQRLSMHSVFIGPPGTGKTTIARMMADIYFSLNVLNENNFVEVDRAGLVAGYVGQTAIKTDDVISSAMNGVLFIDEAYTLARKNSEGDFGQEAIDILLKRMEDSRDKLVVIVAGYEDEMMAFLNSNPGLASRFNRVFNFADYRPSQLMEIYTKIADTSGFVLSGDVSNKLMELFGTLYTQKNSRFGNARLVRNVFEKTFERHANRTASIIPITRTILTTFLVEDIPYDEFVDASDPPYAS